MKLAASRIGILCLSAALLSGCETMGEWADATADTVGGWYDSAASGLSSSDESVIAKQVDDIDEADAASIATRTARALDSSPAGRPVTWSNPPSGVKAHIVPGKTVVERKQIQDARRRDVLAASNMVLIGRTYRAAKNANLRAGPTTKSKVVGGLVKGERFTAIGKVNGEDWIAVGINGKTVGYVFATLVAPAKSGGKAQLREVLALEDQHPEGFGDNVVIETITVSTACRDVNYTVTTGAGSAEQKQFRACKARDGAWEVN